MQNENISMMYVGSLGMDEPVRPSGSCLCTGSIDVPSRSSNIKEGLSSGAPSRLLASGGRPWYSVPSLSSLLVGLSLIGRRTESLTAPLFLFFRTLLIPWCGDKPGIIACRLLDRATELLFQESVTCTYYLSLLPSYQGGCQ